jgi:hypothetical protein
MQKRRQEEDRLQTIANARVLSLPLRSAQAQVNMEVTVDATQVFAPRDEDDDRKG